MKKKKKNLTISLTNVLKIRSFTKKIKNKKYIYMASCQPVTSALCKFIEIPLPSPTSRKLFVSSQSLQ